MSVLTLLLTVLPAPGSPTATAEVPDALTIPSRYLRQQVAWQTCDIDYYVRSLVPGSPELLCGRIVVPQDWRHPEAHPDLTLAVSLSRATGRSQGVLTLNPGGPGVSGRDATALFAVSRPRLFAEFDLLGFDPRGFGDSTPLVCRVGSTAWEGRPTVADHRVRSRAARTAEVAEAKLVAKACGSATGAAYVSTRQTVDDLEFLRAWVAAHTPDAGPRYERLNYIGYSYGSWLGAWYADRYPARTGRFVLDSNLDWTSTFDANDTRDPGSFQRRRDAMFFPWLARHHKTYGLGRTTAAVRATYERTRTVVQRAWRDGLSPARAEDLDADLYFQLYVDAEFPQAAETLRAYVDLADGGGGYDRVRPSAALDGIARRSQARASAAATTTLSAAVTVRCNDTAFPRDVSAVLRRTDTMTRRYSFVGYWNNLTACSYWPHAASGGTIDLAGTPRLLMLQSEGDPATAYEGALRAHRRTAASTRLVSLDDGGQHGLYLSGVSPCIDAIADRYLFTGVVPARDTVCRARPLPGDRTVATLKGPVRPGTSDVGARSLDTGRADAATPGERLVRRLLLQGGGWPTS